MKKKPTNALNNIVYFEELVKATLWRYRNHALNCMCKTTTTTTNDWREKRTQRIAARMPFLSLLLSTLLFVLSCSIYSFLYINAIFITLFVYRPWYSYIMKPFHKSVCTGKMWIVNNFSLVNDFLFAFVLTHMRSILNGTHFWVCFYVYLRLSFLLLFGLTAFYLVCLCVYDSFMFILFFIWFFSCSSLLSSVFYLKAKVCILRFFFVISCLRYWFFRFMWFLSSAVKVDNSFNVI